LSPTRNERQRRLQDVGYKHPKLELNDFEDGDSGMESSSKRACFFQQQKGQQDTYLNDIDHLLFYSEMGLYSVLDSRLTLASSNSSHSNRTSTFP
jgi:hypothetical protein